MLNWVRKVILTRPSQSLLLLMSGQGVVALAGLAYGKLTAIYIPPAVWGDYSLLFVAMTLLQSLFITPTLQSFKAALVQFPKQQAVTFYGRLLLFIYLILLLPIFLLGIYYQRSIFSLIWLAALGQGIVQFGSNYLNALGQHRRYTLLQTGYSIATLIGFGFIVVALEQRTVAGLWQVLLVVNVIWAAIAGWQLMGDNKDVFRSAATTDLSELRQACKRYVWPLLSLALWGWLINYADRYLIRFYLTDADVGQYTMGYSLGSKLLLVIAPVLSFLSPQILRLRATGESSETANQLIWPYLFYYVLLAGTGCLIFYLGREWIGELLLSDRYAPAFLVGPIVAIGYLFLTSIHVLELKWYAFGQTRFVLWHNVLGAFLNIGFNFLLIPRMGILGAALATLLGFFGQFLLAIWLFLSVRYN